MAVPIKVYETAVSGLGRVKLDTKLGGRALEGLESQWASTTDLFKQLAETYYESAVPSRIDLNIKVLDINAGPDTAQFEVWEGGNKVDNPNLEGKQATLLNTLTLLQAALRGPATPPDTPPSLPRGQLLPPAEDLRAALQEKADLESRLHELDEECQAQLRENQRLEALVNEREADIDQLSEQGGALIKGLVQEKEKLQADLFRVNRRCAALEAEIRDFEKLRALDAARLAQKSGHIDLLDRQIREAEEQIQRMRQEIRDLKARPEPVDQSSELERLQAALNKKTAAVNKARGEREAIEKELLEATNKLRRVQQANKLQALEVDRLGRDNLQLQEQLAAQHKEIAALRGRVKEGSHQRIRQLQEKKDRIQQKQDLAEVDHLKDQLRKAEQAHLDAREQGGYDQQEIRRLRDQLALAKEQHNLEHQVKRLEESKRDAEKQLQPLQQEIAQLQLQLASREEELRALQAKPPSNIPQDQVARLQRTLGQEREKLAAATKQVEELNQASVVQDRKHEQEVLRLRHQVARKGLAITEQEQLVQDKVDQLRQADLKLRELQVLLKQSQARASAQVAAAEQADERAHVEREANQHLTGRIRRLEASAAERERQFKEAEERLRALQEENLHAVALADVMKQVIHKHPDAMPWFAAAAKAHQP